MCFVGESGKQGVSRHMPARPPVRLYFCPDMCVLRMPLHLLAYDKVFEFRYHLVIKPNLY
jgi:hypothetical protein